MSNHRPTISASRDEIKRLYLLSLLITNRVFFSRTREDRTLKKTTSGFSTYVPVISTFNSRLSCSDYAVNFDDQTRAPRDARSKHFEVSPIYTAVVRMFRCSCRGILINKMQCSTPDNEAAFGEEEACAHKSLPRRT